MSTSTIVHISDPHFAVGMHSVRATRAALNVVERVNALPVPPAAVVITGDIADTGSAEEYRQASEVLRALAPPVVLVPGNHDNSELLFSELAEPLGLPIDSKLASSNYYLCEYDLFDVLACDSSVVAKHYGLLGVDQLAWIQEHVQRRSAKPLFIALHHHPVASSLGVMDEVPLVDAESLAAVLGSRERPVTILTGHLHRFVFAQLAGVPVLTAGSVNRTVEYRPTEDRVGRFVDEPVSMFIHHVRDTGEVVSHVVPVLSVGPPLGRF